MTGRTPHLLIVLAAVAWAVTLSLFFSLSYVEAKEVTETDILGKTHSVLVKSPQALLVFNSPDGLINNKKHEFPSLIQVVRQTIEWHFAKVKSSLDDLVQQLPVASKFKVRAGVFVTLSKNGHPRACWGSLYPEQPDIVKSTVYATVEALTKEYRYPPIKKSEWKSLKPQVTVVRRIQPIKGLTGQNPRQDGLLIVSGGKTAVILPGETSDAYYQLVSCRLKAGIKPNEPYQLYRIKADIYE